MILVLSLTILFALAAVLMINLPQLVTSSDVVLKNATALAAKAAANQYEIGENDNDDDSDEGDKTNKDNGFPVINYQKARSSFESVLAGNLELKQNLEPDRYSSFAGAPHYKLIIYNGQHSPSGITYERYNGQTRATEIQAQGFPQTFTVAQEIQVELKSPGVIAIVEAPPLSIDGSDKTCGRWAAASLARQKNENWIVLLQGSREI